MILQKCIFILVCSMYFGLDLSAQKSESVFDEPNIMYAKFPGGQDSMLSFLKRNLNFPDSFLDVAGIISVSAIIDTLGKLTDIKVVRGVHKEFDAEALRVIHLMPNWIPYKIEDKAYKKGYKISYSSTEND
ncbi:MAG: hypothetical protein EOP53_08365, partial [Sphingobacteriales bacterium]